MSKYLMVIYAQKLQSFKTLDILINLDILKHVLKHKNQEWAYRKWNHIHFDFRNQNHT